MTCYFGWLAVFDGYYNLVTDWGVRLSWGLVKYTVGLPTFLLGCAFVAGVVLSATPEDRAIVHRPECS